MEGQVDASKSFPLLVRRQPMLKNVSIGARKLLAVEQSNAGQGRAE